MKLIVCLDERRGMMFNKRRQSRDRLLIEDMARHVEGSKLYMTAYSAPLFAECAVQIEETEHPFASCGPEDFVFLEAALPPEGRDRITEVVLYHWNRHYPSDVQFDLDMTPFRLISSAEFAGSSHEKITKEVWKK